MSVLSRLSGSSEIATVGTSDAQELVRVGAVLAEVRAQGEWGARSCPNAEHHPLGGLATSTDRPPTDRTVVVAGGSGTRLADALTSAGLDAVNRRGEKDQ